MPEESISQEFRVKNIEKNRKLLNWRNINSINRTTLNCVENLLIFSSTIIGCVSIIGFASLVGILIGITSSAIGLKICAITVWI